MNRPLLKHISSIVLGGTAVIALGVSMALAQGSAPSSGPRSDGQIEMDVVHALDGSQALKDDLITAATIQGEVTLSGTVASESSRKLAESLTQTVPGVTKVHNNLKVGNPAQDANAQGVPADQMGRNDQDYANDQPQPAAPQAENPDYGQNPGVNQNPPPDWGRSQQPSYGQGQQPGYGQNPPPQRGQYPGPGSGSGSGSGPEPGYGQAPPPPPPYGQGYPPQYPPQYPRQYPQQPPPPQYQVARGPVTVPAGTLIQVRTNQPINSKQARGGEPVQFTVIQDVAFGGVLAIPRGATVQGVIAEVQHPEKGSLTGSTELGLQLTSLDLGGQSYPLQSDLFKVKGPGKGERSAGNIVGGALLGAMIGGIAGGGTGAAIGAAAGGGVGAAGSAASSGPGVWIPAEALVSFHLAAPVVVEPVSGQEAMRLAQGLYPGGPRLYQRGPYGYPYRPNPYYYAPVYYRPYYSVGGYYYWR
jgi:BON domain